VQFAVACVIAEINGSLPKARLLPAPGTADSLFDSPQNIDIKDAFTIPDHDRQRLFEIDALWIT
jgi:hypothetical protein